MRPRRMAAEIDRAEQPGAQHLQASMRPRRMAAEIRALQAVADGKIQLQ